MSSEIDEPASDDLVADFYDEAQGDGLVSVARGPLRSLVARARLALSQPALPGQEAFEALSAAQTPLEPEYAAALYSNRSELYMKSAPEVPDTQDIADAQTALDEYHEKGGKTMAEVEAELADGDPINRWVTILDAAAPSSFVGWTNPDPEVPDTGGLVERTVVYNDPADIYAANIERDLAIDRAQAAEQALAEAAAELSRLQENYNEAYQATIKLQAKLATATEDNKRLREALTEAKLQIEYLHGKFKETGSGNGVIAKIDAALTLAKGEQP